MLSSLKVGDWVIVSHKPTKIKKVNKRYIETEDGDKFTIKTAKEVGNNCKIYRKWIDIPVSKEELEKAIVTYRKRKMIDKILDVSRDELFEMSFEKISTIYSLIFEVSNKKTLILSEINEIQTILDILPEERFLERSSLKQRMKKPKELV